MTKFSSGPDSFALSQSWGVRPGPILVSLCPTDGLYGLQWKSTSLAAALELPSDTSEDGLGGRHTSMRVTIVMGIV
jgi:hypothetical protein